MCFLYHTHATLKSLASTEESLPSFMFLDPEHTEVSYHRHHLDLRQVTRMVQELSAEAQKILDCEMFFGEDVPHGLMVEYKISHINDDMQNLSPGYSFLDDPRNPFRVLRTAYPHPVLQNYSSTSSPSSAHSRNYSLGISLMPRRPNRFTCTCGLVCGGRPRLKNSARCWECKRSNFLATVAIP